MYSIVIDDAFRYLREKATISRMEFGLRLDNAPYLDRCIVKVVEYLSTMPNDLAEYKDTITRLD